ncbi:MAG: hypothetical protein AABO58_03375 [Acidobacteriota bacterium]
MSKDVLQRIVFDIDAALPDHELSPFRDAIHYIATLQGRAGERAIAAAST